MTARTQKRLAIAGAGALVAVVLGANAQLLLAAIGSHPDCVAADAAPAPADPAC